MKIKDWIQKSGYIYLSLGILILALVFAVTMVSLFWTEEKANQTTVGTIYLGDKSAQEYEISILLGVSEWQNKANYYIHYHQYTKEIPLDVFVIDLASTLLNLKEGQKNPVKFILSEQMLSEFEADMLDYFGPVIFGALDIEKLIQDVAGDVENMSLQKEYSLYSYLDTDLSKTSLTVSTIINISSNDVNEILALVNEIHIPANKRFSLLDAIGGSGLSNEQMSIIASGIQSAIMPTGFSGIIRQQYLEPPSWSEVGKNVRILQVSRIDFSFFNPLDIDFVLKIEKKDSKTLQFVLQGFPFLAIYSVDSVTDDKVAFQTKYIEDITIGPDIEDVEVIELEFETIYRILEQEGQNGSITTFYRTVVDPDEKTVTSSILQEFMIPRDLIYRQNTVVKEAY